MRQIGPSISKYVLVVLMLVLAAGLLIIPEAAATGNQPLAQHNENKISLLGIIIPTAILILVVGFLSLFVPKVSLKKLRFMIAYTYIFTICALVGSVLPFFLLSADKHVRTDTAAGLVLGCAVEDRTSLPAEVLCRPVGEGSETKPPYRLWLLHIGGGLQGQAGAPPYVTISGGLIIPLYVVALALMGAAVSMTRRVPEYQRAMLSADDAATQTVMTKLHLGSKHGETEEQRLARVRESLVFQIMQVISAPLVALAAYYIFSPGTRIASVLIAFSAGFASGLILQVIRAATERIKVAAHVVDATPK